jgi:hypothetical protein
MNVKIYTRSGGLLLKSEGRIGEVVGSLGHCPHHLTYHTRPRSLEPVVGLNNLVNMDWHAVSRVVEFMSATKGLFTEFVILGRCRGTHCTVFTS